MTGSFQETHVTIVRPSFGDFSKNGIVSGILTLENVSNLWRYMPNGLCCFDVISYLALFFSHDERDRDSILRNKEKSTMAEGQIV